MIHVTCINMLSFRPLAHVPSTPIHSRHTSRSSVTYWCALAREDGSMEVDYKSPVFINTL